jgi:hypothetical protein
MMAPFWPNGKDCLGIDGVGWLASEVPPVQLDSVATGNTVEVAEILVVQEGAIRAVVPRRLLGIGYESALGIVALDLVHPILVTPVAVLVLAIEVIVLAWMNDHCDFARSHGTFLCERAVGQVGNIRFKQLLNETAGAAFGIQETFGKLIVRTRLVILRYTRAGVVVALMHERGIQHVHTIRQTVMRCLNAWVTIVLGRIVLGF